MGGGGGELDSNIKMWGTHCTSQVSKFEDWYHLGF